MATNPSYSWFGEVAMIRWVVVADGYGDKKNYVMTFPKRSREDVGLFLPVDVDLNTALVDKKACL